MAIFTHSESILRLSSINCCNSKMRNIRSMANTHNCGETITCDMRPLYSNAYAINPMLRLAQTYETSFINHIGRNAWTWLFTFCRNFENDGCIIYSTLHPLFTADNLEVPNQRLLSHTRFFLDWNGETFFNIDKNSGYWRHIELLYKLQYFNHVNGLKNFKLCPTQRFGLRHIRIDTTALIHLIARSKAGNGI